MKHPSRAQTREARTRPVCDHYADGFLHAEPTENAKANARAGALHGAVLAVAILLLVVPIILLTNGCSTDVIAADFSIPGVLLMERLREV
jgi:hypothetical protein